MWLRFVFPAPLMYAICLSKNFTQTPSKWLIFACLFSGLLTFSMCLCKLHKCLLNNFLAYVIKRTKFFKLWTEFSCNQKLVCLQKHLRLRQFAAELLKRLNGYKVNDANLYAVVWQVNLCHNEPNTFVIATTTLIRSRIDHYVLQMRYDSLSPFMLVCHFFRIHMCGTWYLHHNHISLSMCAPLFTELIMNKEHFMYTLSTF